MPTDERRELLAVILCRAERDTPIREANDTPSMREQEILPDAAASDTPFFGPRIGTDFHRGRLCCPALLLNSAAGLFRKDKSAVPAD